MRFDYGRLTDAESGAYVLELVSPYVLSSAYPDADDQSVPWWWDAFRRRSRRRSRQAECRGRLRRMDGVMTG